MPETDTGDTLLLPPGTRLLYIGPPKTGTTSLQRAAAQARPQLLHHGVLYPGKSVNHRRQIYALMKRPEAPVIPTDSGASPSAMDTPSLDEWRSFVAEIDAEPTRRVLISHETASTATDEMARTFIQELGSERVHVAITLRPPLAILPARWVELLKEGETVPFDEWLRRLYRKSDPSLPAVMLRYLDMAALVERWVAAAGADHVTVVVVDKSQRELLTDTFENLLGLPRRMLQGRGTGDQTNRSMSQVEADIIRRANVAIKKGDKATWRLYLNIIRSGAVQRLLRERVPGDGEPRVQMPDWAAELALRDGKEYADRILATGVRVVGDIGRLYRPPSGPHAAGSVDTDAVVDIAVHALVGAVEGAAHSDAAVLGEVRRARQQLKKVTDDRAAVRAKLAAAQRETQAERDKAQRALAQLHGRSIREQVRDLLPQERAQRAADSFTTHDLARALSIRLRHKIRTRRSMRLK